MSACFCTGACHRTGRCPSAVVVGDLWPPQFVMGDPSHWIIVTQPSAGTTGSPGVEPEPQRTAKSIPQDDPHTPAPSPLAGSWQCGGCGTIYPAWVNKCECQKRNMVGSAAGTNVPPISGLTSGDLPCGTFTTELP